jgi:hypothetical protein
LLRRRKYASAWSAGVWPKPSPVAGSADPSLGCAAAGAAAAATGAAFGAASAEPLAAGATGAGAGAELLHARSVIIHNPSPILRIVASTTAGSQPDGLARFISQKLSERWGVPVVMDCTHSLQQPNQSAGITGGNPELIETIAKAAIATGAHGLFIETHPNPAVAKSDGANMLPLHLLEPLLEKLVRLKKAI